jgi:phosphomannomutase
VNIFEPYTPLHDGAAIIGGKRILAAACYLPLTENPFVSTELGTRHRAALGITEQSDAIAVVVSEETGIISLAEGGKLIRGLRRGDLEQKLKALQGQGRILVRPSGTEPLVRVMGEALDELKLKEVVDELSGIIEEKLGCELVIS